MTYFFSNLFWDYQWQRSKSSHHMEFSSNSLSIWVLQLPLSILTKIIKEIPKENHPQQIFKKQKTGT